MDRYEIVRLVGEGSFGWVYQAIDNDSRQFVAIKRLKPDDDPWAYVPEVRALTRLEHPNIVSFKGVEYQDDDVFLIFEYMEGGSLCDLIDERRSRRIPFSEAEIRSLSRQVLQGLEFMHHQRGFMHRDLKPENLLVNKGDIKISDLGTATEIDCGGQAHHHYVTTRWYRAPEMFRAFVKNESLRPFEYNEKVDLWAMGTIIAELFLMHPLFQGDDSPDQLYRICEVIGAPSRDSRTMPKLGPENGVGLRALMPYGSESAIDLIESLCSWDPSKRPSAKEALQHPFFKRGQNVDAPPGFSYCTHTRNSVVPKMTELSTMQPILGAY